MVDILIHRDSNNDTVNLLIKSVSMLPSDTMPINKEKHYISHVLILISSKTNLLYLVFLTQLSHSPHCHIAFFYN